MKPDTKWLKDWRIGENPTLERALADQLLSLFIHFWEDSNIDDKAKKTKSRYSNALHALRGYLIEQAVLWHEEEENTMDELLFKYITKDEGPLIFQDNENWQAEVDMVCRKLYRYMINKDKKV